MTSFNDVKLPVAISEDIYNKNQERIKELTRKVSACGVSKMKLNKLNEKLFDLQDIQRENSKREICIAAIKECIEKWKNKNVINDEKIDEIIMVHDLEITLRLDNNDQFLLDLSHILEKKIPLQDALKLHALFLSQLKYKHDELVQMIEQKSVQSGLHPHYLDGNSDLLQLKTTLFQLAEEFSQANLHLCVIIREYLDLRKSNAHKLSAEVEYNKSKVLFYEMKEKCMLKQVQCKVFQETPDSKQAVDTAIKDLRKQLDNARKNIEEVKNKLNILKNVESKSKIALLLEKYLNLCKKIKQFEFLYDEIGVTC